MSILPDFPIGLDDPRDVKIYNQSLKAIWFQERALLNNPVCDFREYRFRDDPAVAGTQVKKALIKEYTNVPCSVPDLDYEQIANSGGLVLPTDRFLSVYDTNPNILSVVEWPSTTGNLFTIKRKEWNPASGRCEMLIRQENHLTGIVYKHITAQTFDGSSWTVGETTVDIVMTANRNELEFEEQMIFYGVAATGDIVFWILRSSFRTDCGDEDTQFSPAVRDIIEDIDISGNTVQYRVISYKLEQGEDFYRILARRYEES